MWTLYCALVSCNPAPEPPPDFGPEPDPVTAAEYAAIKEGIAATRANLAGRWATTAPADRAALIDEARTAAFDAITTELIPTWKGTDWAFYGATQTPRTGTIACGYFVSTVLQDAGFDVERVTMAQQASEHIIMTMSPSSAIWRYRGRTRSQVATHVEAQGDGLYIVGLDYHVGFLVKEADTLQMCHSDPNDGVVCEDARTSSAFVSDYRVVGRVLHDETVEKWLDQSHFTTVKP